MGELILAWSLVAVVVVIGIGTFVARSRLHKRRVATFAALATRRGWRYVVRDDDLASRYLGSTFRSFGSGATHVLTGEHRDRRFATFEYVQHKVMGGGQHKRHDGEPYTLLVLDIPAVSPTLEVVRQSIEHRMYGPDDTHVVRLESDEFNKRFLICSQDDKFAYDILHPRMMEWMLGDPRALEIPLRFERGHLMTWHAGLINLERVTVMLDYLCDVLDRTPTFVWKP